MDINIEQLLTNNNLDIKKSKLYESAMIKSIRRGLVDDAVHWTACLYNLGKQDIIWRRIFIHMSEDIGMANPILPAQIMALFNSYKILTNNERASYEPEDAMRLPIVHAIVMLTTSEKSRAIDDIITCEWEDKFNTMDIPKYAIDFHSPLGKRLGLDVDHFFEVSGQITNETKDFENKWNEKAKNIMHKKKDNI